MFIDHTQKVAVIEMIYLIYSIITFSFIECYCLNWLTKIDGQNFRSIPA